jgi:hypothetical protein
MEILVMVMIMTVTQFIAHTLTAPLNDMHEAMLFE